MKKLLLIPTVLLICMVGIIFLIAIPKIEKDITTHLQTFGFKDIIIEETRVGLTNISIDNIALDTKHSNRIKNINLNINWLNYLFNNQIKSIRIEELNLTNTTTNIGTLLSYKKNINFKKLSAIPANKIQIKKVLWETVTPQGVFNFDASILIQKEDDKHKLTAFINTNQDKLSFLSQWSGTIDNNNNLQIEGTFNDFKIAHHTTEIHRGTGWMTYQETNEKSTIAGQVDAGSGKIFSIPANNIALIIGQEEDHYPILLRAQASGIPDVRLTMDMHYTNKIENQSFETTLSIKKPTIFFDYLEKQNIVHKKIKRNNYNNVPTNLTLSYLPEKRFADGPIPFNISVKQDLKDTMSGTFLIYPDSFDIRGTAEVTPPLLELIQSLWTIKEDNISGDVIRIDGNLKSFSPSSN